MLKRKINRVDIEGNNNFVFQYIDAEGKSIEERKSFEEFLQPFIKPYQDQIKLLEKSLSDKQKLEGFLDKEVIELSGKLERLKSEKEQLEKQAANLLKELEGKDLSQNSSLYQEAFALFTDAKINEALEVLDDAKLEEEERKAKNAMIQNAENRVLKGRILLLDFKYLEAIQNFKKAVYLNDDWSFRANLLNTMGVLYEYSNEPRKSGDSYLEAINIYEGEDLKEVSQIAGLADVYNNYAILLKFQYQHKKASEFFEKSIEKFRFLSESQEEYYLHKLAGTLGNASVVFKNLGNRKSILYIQEAIDIYKKLVEKNSDDYSYYFAGQLLNSVDLLPERHKEKVLLDVISMSQDLAKRDSPDFYVLLARAYCKYGSFKKYLKLFSEAKILYKKAESILESRAALDIKLLPELANVFRELGDIAYLEEDGKKAEDFFLQELAIQNALSTKNPNQFEYQVASVLLCLSNVYTYRFKNRDKSIEYAESAIKLFRKYESSIPQSKIWIHNSLANIKEAKTFN